jgi:hypothetical protein
MADRARSRLGSGASSKARILPTFVVCSASTRSSVQVKRRMISRVAVAVENHCAGRKPFSMVKRGLVTVYNSN